MESRLSAIRHARDAGLRYVSDDEPGYTRIRQGGTFIYLDERGRRLRNQRVLRRIAALAIPPAYSEVWIAPHDNGHLQATARDARGRKQYRYHARWREVRDENKYGRMLAFGQALPRIRRRVSRDLKLAGMPRNKVLATLVRLLETTFMRVGNEEYLRTNHSFGLTTLRNRHVAVNGSTLRFDFKGKGGVKHDIAVSDPRVARVVRQCLDIPGQQLFQYLDDEGKRHSVGSGELNDYLREIAGAEFTAKDFRTWAGTVLAARELRALGPHHNQRQARQNIMAAIRRAADQLGNTAAICRKCYVHPDVLRCYAEDMTHPFWRSRTEATAMAMAHEEAALLQFLGRSRRRSDRRH